jgi:hypothetical protein
LWPPLKVWKVASHNRLTVGVSLLPRISDDVLMRTNEQQQPVRSSPRGESSGLLTMIG